MLTDAAVLPAPVKTEPSRVEVLEHAKEIVLSQGAVKNVVSYWETEDGQEILRDPTPTTLADYRHCRVCVAGAAVLAAVRLGYDNVARYDWFCDVLRAAGVPSSDHLRDIEDNPAEVVRILDLMIDAEKATA